jgi:hypothetical protein
MTLADVPSVNAITFCTGKIAGYSDWRPPNLKELNQATINGIKFAVLLNYSSKSYLATRFFFFSGLRLNLAQSIRFANGDFVPAAMSISKSSSISDLSKLVDDEITQPSDD